GQGTDHPAAAVLALAAAAVVAGMKGYTAITGWVADVSAAVLADLYLQAGAIPAGAPSKTTIWRVLTGADPEMFDAAVGAWLMNAAGFAAPVAGVADDRMPGRGALMQVRLDGKAIRGAKDADGNQVRLLAALVGPDALPWDQVPVAHTATDKGHGRITTRTIQVLPAPDDLPFPHVSQVFLIERYVTGLRGEPVSAVAALGVASPEAGQASPADLARYVREQWSIESLHWIRDSLYQEAKSRVRTRNGPRLMAALRTLALG